MRIRMDVPCWKCRLNKRDLLQTYFKLVVTFWFVCLYILPRNETKQMIFCMGYVVSCNETCPTIPRVSLSRVVAGIVDRWQIPRVCIHVLSVTYLYIMLGNKLNKSRAQRQSKKGIIRFIDVLFMCIFPPRVLGKRVETRKLFRSWNIPSVSPFFFLCNTEKLFVIKFYIFQVLRIFL